MAFAPTTPGPFGRHTRLAPLARVVEVAPGVLIPVTDTNQWDAMPASALVLLFDDETPDSRRLSQRPSLLQASADFAENSSLQAQPSAGLFFSIPPDVDSLSDYIDNGNAAAVPQGFRVTIGDLTVRGPAFILPATNPGFVNGNTDPIRPASLKMTVEMFGKIQRIATQDSTIRASILLHSSDLTERILEDRFVVFAAGGYSFKADVVGTWFDPLL